LTPGQQTEQRGTARQADWTNLPWSNSSTDGLTVTQQGEAGRENNDQSE